MYEGKVFIETLYGYMWIDLNVFELCEKGIRFIFLNLRLKKLVTIDTSIIYAKLTQSDIYAS